MPAEGPPPPDSGSSCCCGFRSCSSSRGRWVGVGERVGGQALRAPGRGQHLQWVHPRASSSLIGRWHRVPTGIVVWWRMVHSSHLRPMSTASSAKAVMQPAPCGAAAQQPSTCHPPRSPHLRPASTASSVNTPMARSRQSYSTLQVSLLIPQRPSSSKRKAPGRVRPLSAERHSRRAGR
jgi:hypothetical protein